MNSKPYTLLIEDDCLDAMKAIPDDSVGMILCDLPYGTTQNSWDCTIPLDKLWEQYRRILAPHGVIALLSQGVFTARLILSASDLFKYKITWVKSKATNFLNAKKQPLRKHEDVCIFYERQPVYIPQMWQSDSYDKGVRKNQLTGSYGDFQPSRIKSNGSRYPTDVVYFKTAEAEGPVWHPTQKPVELGKYLIATYTSQESLVLDNSFGSGSFLLAAAFEGRNAIGIELNKDILQFKNERLDLIEVAEGRLDHISHVSTVKRVNNHLLRNSVDKFLEKTEKTMDLVSQKESYHCIAAS